jgi:phosphatidylserine decarboxylase
MGIRVEVLPFLAASLAAGLILALVVRLFRVSWRRAAVSGVVLAAVGCAYMCWFFRDPERTAPADPAVIVAAADGKIAKIVTLGRADFERAARASGLADMSGFATGDVVRVSIFLSLFDVHVNRAPIAGQSTFLGYFPGKRLFTFDDKSSEENQHNAILIEGEATRCLVYQIVGPVARRVVYWPAQDRAVPLKKGEPFGMMKFGSRLDMYFPADEVALTAREGERVAAGETVIGRVVRAGEAP